MFSPVTADSKIADNKTTEFMEKSDYNIVVYSHTSECNPLLCYGKCAVGHLVDDFADDSVRIVFPLKTNIFCWPKLGFHFSDRGRSKYFSRALTNNKIVIPSFEYIFYSTIIT